MTDLLLPEPILADVADVPEQGAGALHVQVGDEPVGLFRVGDEIVGWRSVCPHAAAPVCQGVVDGTRVTSAVYEYRYGRDDEVLQCPWHGWEFDLANGQHLAEGSSARLRRHPIRVADGHIYDATPSSRVDLALTVSRVTRETERVLAIELTASGGAKLPTWAPGAHIQLELPSGLVRHFSLCGDPKQRDVYKIAVLQEADGRGGSEELHRTAATGLSLRATAIRNRFPLTVARNYLLIAGGIGITALLPMAAALRRRRKPFTLIYTGKERGSMTFVDEVSGLANARIVESALDGRIDIGSIVRDAAAGTAIFACGPDALLADVRTAVRDASRPLELHTEAFQTSGSSAREYVDHEFVVELSRTGASLTVPAGQSVLRTVRDAGVTAPSSCEDGWCGTCETRVLDGEVEHRDSVLSDDEIDRGDTMMICVSRARSGALVLDL